MTEIVLGFTGTMLGVFALINGWQYTHAYYPSSKRGLRDQAIMFATSSVVWWVLALLPAP